MGNYSIQNEEIQEILSHGFFFKFWEQEISVVVLMRKKKRRYNVLTPYELLKMAKMLRESWIMRNFHKSAYFFF